MKGWGVCVVWLKIEDWKMLELRLRVMLLLFDIDGRGNIQAL